MQSTSRSYAVNLAFEAIKLPPVTDILVLGKKHPQGKRGIIESFRFMAPDEFEMIEIGDDVENVGAVLINQRILKRLSADEIVAVLKSHVFPCVSKGEAVKVDLSVRVTVSGIEGDAL